MSLYSKRMFVTLFALITATVSAGDYVATSASVPEGFQKYLYFMSSAIAYDTGSGTPGIIVSDGSHYQMNILGRTAEEMAESALEAQTFFTETFGLDLTSGDVVFFAIHADLNTPYRNYVSSGDRVPSEGWVVNDGAWMAAVVNPEGLTLGGAYEGLHVPAGASFVRGTYKVDRTRTLPQFKASSGETQELEPYVIDYWSLEPIITRADGSFVISCALYNEEWGYGRALGISMPTLLEDGTVVTNVRNNLTFPASLVIPEHFKIIQEK